jgi:uncharacterized membrane protein
MGRTRSFGSVWGPRLLRRSHVHSHPRLLGAVAVAIIVYFFLSDGTATATRLLIAFDGGALIFLAAIWVMMARATPDGMRRRAEVEDEGRYSVLTLSVAAATAILLTIVFELYGIKDLPPGLAGLRVALATATILLSWLFMNTIFALHYAHGYYGNSDPSSEYKPAGGLIFPAEPSPTIGIFSTFPSSLA